MKNFIGSPQRPQPGIDSRRITTFAKKKTDGAAQEPPQFRPPSAAVPEPRNVRITKEMSEGMVLLLDVPAAAR